MAHGKVLLLEVLKDLEAKDMSKLKWYLRESVPDGYPPIPKSRLEGADREDMVDLLVQTYSMEGALVITTHILKQMNRNELLKKLTGMNFVLMGKVNALGKGQLTPSSFALLYKAVHAKALANRAHKPC